MESPAVEDRLRFHLESILESTDDGIFVLNRNEEVIVFNPACERLTGLSRGQVLGGRLTCDEIFRCHRFANRRSAGPCCGTAAEAAPLRGALPVVPSATPEESVACCAVFDIFREHKEKAREEILLISRAGKARWVEISFSPVVDAGGETTYTVGVLRGIDDRKRAEQEIQRKNAELECALGALRERTRQLIHAEKMASIGQLAAGIAHELNTPLNTILGYSQLFRKGLRPPMVSDEIEAIEAATKRCRDIVQSLLDFSRRSDGFRAPRLLNKIVGRAFSLLKHDLEKRKIGYALELDRGRHEVVADENQLEQVFVNLASNACDAMTEGGRITVRTRPLGERIEILFEDTGHGIAKDVLPRIFEPFFTTKAVGKGTGLGLSIVARIVEEHQGSIDVESVLGEGTRFRILLPLSRAGSGERAASPGGGAV